MLRTCLVFCLFVLAARTQNLNPNDNATMFALRDGFDLQNNPEFQNPDPCSWRKITCNNGFVTEM